MLIKCPECNKEVSDKATNCPHCGFPLKRKDKNDLKEVDFSNSEILLHRGIATYLKVLIYVIGPIFIGLFIALLIMFLLIGKDAAFAIVFGIILGIVIPLMIAFIIIASVKFKNNRYLEYDNLYFDKDAKMFYAQLWNKKIAQFDSKEDIRVGVNRRGFDETVIVYKGLRYNTGFSSSNVNEANQRIKEIQEELRKQG